MANRESESRQRASGIEGEGVVTKAKRKHVFEGRHQRLAPVPVFIRRIVGAVAVSGGLAVVALFVGVAGYHWIVGFDWVDAILNASMILGGMGPVDPMKTTAGKLFASAYALFSGLVFIANMGIVLAPLAHRMLHRFHIDDTDLQG